LAEFGDGGSAPASFMSWTRKSRSMIVCCIIQSAGSIASLADMP
jgi:hypothetical protein